MSRHHPRDRHLVSARTISILRIFGWRYSIAREAWVLRLGGGRIGPVFRDLEAPESEVESRMRTQVARSMSHEVLQPIPTRRPSPAEAPDERRPEVAKAALPVRPTTPPAPPPALDEPGGWPEAARVDGRPPPAPVRTRRPGRLMPTNRAAALQRAAAAEAELGERKTS